MPYIVDVISFYGPNLEFIRSDRKESQFVKGVTELDKRQFVPIAKIILSNFGNVEEAFVHELLHLWLPLSNGFYLSPSNAQDPGDDMSKIANLLEHELMLPHYIKLGYSIDHFLINGFNVYEYEELDKPPKWWLFEYFRIQWNMNHVNELKIVIGIEALQNLREISIVKLPVLAKQYADVDEWIVNFRSGACAYPLAYSLLSEIFDFGVRDTYFSADMNFKNI